MILCAALVITNKSRTKKIQIDHGDTVAANRICNISANISPFFIPDERRYPYNRALMKLCSDPHGKKKQLSTPSQEIMDSDLRHLLIPTIGEEEQGHF